MLGLLGVLVNTFTVFLGSSVGIICKKGIPKKVSDAVMIVLGLCTFYIGIDGALQGENTLVLILSLVFGCVIGTLLNIDGGINKCADFLSSKFSKDNSNQNFSKGFVTASLLFCIGSLTIVGSIQSGINGDNSMIYTKSVLDLVSSTILASALGFGVMFAAVFVLLFQGALVILASILGSFLSTQCVNELICVGSVMIIGLGLNLINVTKIKVANLLPSLLFVPLFCWIFSFFGM